MNLPDVPPKSNFLHKDTLGNPVKRAYVRKPKPRDAHYEEYLEDLSPSERAAYEDQFRS